METSAPPEQHSLHDSLAEKHKSGFRDLITWQLAPPIARIPCRIWLLFKDIISGIPSLYGNVVVEKYLAKEIKKNVQASSERLTTDLGISGKMSARYSFVMKCCLTLSAILKYVEFRAT